MGSICDITHLPTEALCHSTEQRQPTPSGATKTAIPRLYSTRSGDPVAAEVLDDISVGHFGDLEQQLADANSRNRELRTELERADQNLDDLRTAMRMLEAAPQDRGPKKRWYRRSAT